MKNKLFLSVVLISSFLLYAPAAEADGLGTASTYPGYVIQQQVSQAGPLTIFISSVAVRCNTPMGNVVFIAPKWDCYFFNDDSRRYVCFDHDSWMKRLVTMNNGRVLGAGWSKLRQEPVKGLPANVYSKGDPNLPTGSIAWISDAPDFRQAAQVILPMLTQIGVDFPPDRNGFPIQVLGHNDDTGKNVQIWEWQTTNVKKTNIPASIFGFPKQYRLAKDEFEVMTTTSMDEQMDLYGTMKKEMKKTPAKKPAQ